MASPALDEKVALLARTLAGKQVPHAFGGALALAYYATPRGTEDIDLNVFVAAAGAGRVLGVLAELGIDTGGEAGLAKVERDGQLRVRWEHTPIDLFFSYDALHESCMGRCRTVPFGEGETIQILSAEDLIVFKVIFNRDKDWSDVEEMLYALAGDLDADYGLTWQRRILDAGDPRLARFEKLLRSP